MIDLIKQLAKEFFPEYVSIRRHLHAHPELSYEEFETSKFVQARLSALGIPFEIKATTGVIGIIEGQNPTKKVVALRADMDALPILEENDVEYKSTISGKMHACGHDVHTTCLLGAAKILEATKHRWEGTVKLIFQPGEEKNPGGASLLIKEKVLHSPAPMAIIGLHVHPGLAVGKVSFRKGKVMASADELYITIKGKGGHASTPHLCVDPIAIAAHLVLALQQVISRNNNPFNPSVLSITAINGGNTTNVIPSEVKLMGTFRAMDESWRSQAHQLIKTIADNTAAAFNAIIDLHIDIGYPCVYNDEALHETAWQQAITYMGIANVEETELRMGAEDFGFYSQQIAGCFFRLGARNEQQGIVSSVHTPTFNVDENCIETGMGMMAWLGIKALG